MKKIWKMHNLIRSSSLVDMAHCWIGHTQRVDKYYIIASADQDRRYTLQEEIAQYVQYAPVMTRVPSVNDIVFAPYEYKIYYRARVMSVHVNSWGFCWVKVSYIDFGDERTVDLSKCLEPCDALMWNHPIYGTLFTLELESDLPEEFLRNSSAHITNEISIFTNTRLIIKIKDERGQLGRDEMTGKLYISYAKTINDFVNELIRGPASPSSSSSFSWSSPVKSTTETTTTASSPSSSSLSSVVKSTTTTTTTASSTALETESQPYVRDIFIKFPGLFSTPRCDLFGFELLDNAITELNSAYFTVSSIFNAYRKMMGRVYTIILKVIWASGRQSAIVKQQLELFLVYAHKLRRKVKMPEKLASIKWFQELASKFKTDIVEENWDVACARIFQLYEKWMDGPLFPISHIKAMIVADQSISFLFKAYLSRNVFGKNSILDDLSYISLIPDQIKMIDDKISLAYAAVQKAKKLTTEFKYTLRFDILRLK